jgi:hypothetical protein
MTGRHNMHALLHSLLIQSLILSANQNSVLPIGCALLHYMLMRNYCFRLKLHPTKNTVYH